MAPVKCTENCDTNFTEGDAITGNLLGGITPFFALLGQDFTYRYLSQSVSVCDWVVFSMVPTGVPFALKAIIRVSKPNKFLRGLAVYPPEERDVIEKELLSSTSEEVCEIWNGHGVERKLLPSSESAPVEEWIYDGNLQPTSRALVRKASRTIRAEPPWSGKPETELSPNLSLNLGPYNRARKLLFLTIIGILLQSSVVVVSALTAFYNPVRVRYFITATRAVRIISFTFVSAGTTLLCLGLAYTAKVIDTSEHVTIWNPRKQNTLAIWIQQKNTALKTEAYVIGKIIKKELVWAHRPLSSCPSTAIACPVAVAIIVGFLLQSIGLSIMHWPVQVLQLVAMTVMFLGRCYARKLDSPDFVVKLDHRISEEDLSELARSKRRQLLNH
ncbi:hypothetical protein ABOM_006492 [Aspergillus bombycis]|uniref:Uncharacterized protein n=1 Tax=Aspergillus bombycis TaxID=109264 RepID=A0A1F8A2F0_9EURO|nr:hypothetical protein ABOM_006492 [Aspergillus bombycis]OGM45525.1 hypothetical protein ABOM_006492 [Aspergillus bombycis]